MIELNGKYNNCKVFTDNIDNQTISQLLNLLNQDFISDSQVRIMPDTHAGKGCVIGTTMTIENKIVPNLVGVDIGCGMRTIKLADKNLDLERLDAIIHKYVPAGFNIHENAIATSGVSDIYAPVNVDNAFKSLGTLGGGNHFIEVDRDESDNYWLVIHTGSRHLGIEICEYYQDLAYKNLQIKANNGKTLEELSKELIAKYTETNRTKEINKALIKLRNQYNQTHLSIPYELAYLEGQAMQNYLHDMKLAQDHARINRETIANQIMKHAKLHEIESFDTIHNYIDIDHMILRKGAISAQEGEKVIIPMNMRDGSLICTGKGNPDWNYSAPHGAGRILSRSKAKQCIDLEDFKESMDGIYTTSVDMSTLDESPFVYKPMQEIIDNIKDTVDIDMVLKPVYNFKAHNIERVLDRNCDIMEENDYER